MAATESRRDLLSFGDWHAGLRELGVQMSAGELAEAYEQAYFWDLNTSFFVEMALASGLYVDSTDLTSPSLSPLHTWLLLLDGFVVRPNGGTAGHLPMANLGPLELADNHDKDKWGSASSKIRHPLTESDPFDLFEAAARLETLTRSVEFSLTPARQSAHEGHGGEGSRVSFEAWFAPHATGLTPFGDDF